jgi:predicted Zn-dependent protease
MLAGVYMTDKRPADAISTLQAAISHNPSDETLVLYLATLDTQSGDNSSAEKVLRAGLAAAPSNLLFKMQLGITLLDEQKTSEGENLLRDVVATSTDPLQLNNAAYELANSSLDLPLAETASHRSLELLDQASNNGETGPNALGRAALIVSAWDTYGWILYREGKVTEAGPWIRAAWRNDNSAETGYHLAILLEKEGHPDQALHQLELAKVGERGADAVAVQKLIADETTKLLKSTSPSATTNPRAELQNQRTYKLPRGTLKPTGQGWASIELEVTAQATTAFRIVDGDQSLQPLADAVQHLNLDLKLPPASHATLVRRGVLSCDTTPTCQLVLVSASSAN